MMLRMNALVSPFGRNDFIMPLLKILSNSKEIEIQEYPANRVLFYKGHLPYGIYILYDGLLNFTVQKYQDLFNHQKVYPMLIGYSSALHREPYPTEVSTASKSKMGFIPNSMMHSFDLFS